MMLKRVGLLVEVAADGEQVVKLAGEKRFDLILMDIQMPVMNGRDACKAIRSDSMNRDTPILAMTANAFEDDRFRCPAAGMQGHIPKPVNPEELYAMLMHWLSQPA